MSIATEARQLLRRTQQGVLSTFSVKYPDYPFGSVTPFILDQQAQPVVLISTLAEHTKNIIANPHVSLLVLAGAEDLQANSRLTLLGNAVRVDKQDDLLRARYLRYFPESASYFAMHDFSCYRISVAHLRYIAGFGKMGWVEAAPDTVAPNRLAEQEAAMIDHMNADHADSLIAYCQHFHGQTAHAASLLGIDTDGFDVRMVGPDKRVQRLRFAFAEPVYDAASARAAFIKLSRACHAA